MPFRVLGAVACGGALGALARYGLGIAFPYGPWTILVVNATGCLLIGVLMGLTEDALLRAFLGTGVLGGYTTFSTYVVDFQRFASQGRPGVAMAYLAGTLVTALVAVATGAAVARRVRR
ncbi:CrcB family protein [Umezawaea sp. Da 62-37]|uniref:fluoride efflux transporter FluC n=1 Tax=Umezawaea sp. Da 62-37 TaxID=3075927 RepID=UPI0028F6CF1C|nr:CrcB family protein [Umezawaea sp. Da 62-37]WNV83430.1 CrcB family protein [Umezawaea sp. Da 62-37]